MPSQAPNPPLIQPFFDEATHTVSYLVSDPGSRQTALIDPVLDYDQASGAVSTAGADRILQAVREQGLDLIWILETHAHADHLSAAAYVRELTGARVGIGEHIQAVQHIFRPVFDLSEEELPGDGREFDCLFADGDTLELGGLTVRVLHTPGHTPACVAYLVGDAVFVGDTLFMPDYGTARADFPGGDARTLYRSIQRLLALPPATRLFMCHDYGAPGREDYAWETTVGQERQHNIHVHQGVDENAFVSMRTRRDAGLSAPALLLPSIQVNIRAGRLPRPRPNGTRYLTIPLRVPAQLARS